MTERATRIKGTQITNDTVNPVDLQSTAFPEDGQVPSYDASAGKFLWTNTVAGAQDLAITLYGDAFVTSKIASFLTGANLNGKTLSYISIKVDVSPTGADLIIDIHKNGTTIFTTQANRPKVANGNTSGSNATPDVQTVATGDIFSIDIDQIGSTAPGGNNLYVIFHLV